MANKVRTAAQYQFSNNIGQNAFEYMHYRYTPQTGYMYSYAYFLDTITLAGTFNANTTYYLYFATQDPNGVFNIWGGYASATNKDVLMSPSGQVILAIEYNTTATYTITYKSPTEAQSKGPEQDTVYTFTDIMGNEHTTTVSAYTNARYTQAAGNMAFTTFTETITDGTPWTTHNKVLANGLYYQQFGWTRRDQPDAILPLYGPRDTIGTPEFGFSTTVSTYGNMTLYPAMRPITYRITVVNNNPTLIDKVSIYRYTTNSLVTATASTYANVPVANLRHYEAKLKDIYGIKQATWLMNSTTITTTTPYMKWEQAFSGVNAVTTDTISISSITYNSYRVIYGKNSPVGNSNVSVATGTDTKYSSYTSYTYNNSLTTIAAPTHATVTFTSSMASTANVHIDQNGGTRGDADLTATGTEYSRTPTTYTFLGWKSDNTDAMLNANTAYTFNATNFAALKTATDNSVIVLNAQWQANAQTTTYSYSYNSITLPNIDDLHHNKGTVMGFSENPDATDPDYLPGSVYTPTKPNTTLYAVWGCGVYKRSPKYEGVASIAGAPAAEKTYTFNNLSGSSVSYTAYPFPSSDSNRGYELLNAPTTSICTATKTMYLAGNVNNHLGTYHYNDSFTIGPNTHEYELEGFTQTGWTKANSSAYVFEIDGIDDGYANTQQYQFGQTITLTDNLTLYPQFVANIYNYSVENNSTNAIDKVAIYNYQQGALAQTTTTTTVSAPFMGMIYLEAKLKTDAGYDYTFTRWEYSEDGGTTYQTLTTNPIYATPYNTFSKNVKFRAIGTRTRSLAGVRIYSTADGQWHTYEPYIYINGKWNTSDAYVYNSGEWKPMG